MTRAKVCVVTGSRADYGLLYWPMRLIKEATDFELQVAVTGMHLAPEFGNTWRLIEQDGFQIDARAEMLLSGDSTVSTTKSIGVGVMAFAEVLDRLKPDLLLVLGDRFEILAAVQAALIARIPVAHLCGGDVTEGAFDESLRHAISKMSHIHLPSNRVAADRLVAMGEIPERVHVVGSPGLDRIRRMSFMERASFFGAIGLKPCRYNIVVAMHPVTLAHDGGLGQLEEVLVAMEELAPEVGLIVSGANADPVGQMINARLTEFVAKRESAVFNLSLGSVLFLNALKHADLIVGNSSSGLYEAPSFGTWTVNVGDRQKGRLRAPTVIDTPPERKAINAAVSRALAMGRGGTENPYGTGYASEAIVEVLRGQKNFSALLRKPFYESLVVNHG